MHVAITASTTPSLNGQRHPLMIWTLCSFAVAAALWLAPPLVERYWSTRRLRRQASASKQIALTYDDGPSDELTPRLLRLLSEHGVRATFFVLGSQV